MRQQVYKGSATDSLKVSVVDYGQKSIPTLALATIWIDGEKTISMASSAIAAEGEVSYVPGATMLDDVYADCQIRWDLTVGGVVRTFSQLFDVVHHKLEKTVTDDDLIGECPALVDEGYRFYGTAESGTALTLVDGELKGFADDHWKGGLIRLLAGAGSVAEMRLTDSAKSTGTLTWATSLTSSVDSTTTYHVTRTFQPEVDRAWDDLEVMIRQRGRRPQLIIGVEDLRPLHIPLSLAKVCRGLARQSDDIWWQRADYYENVFGTRWKNTVFLYDTDDDEVADTEARIRPMFRR